MQYLARLLDLLLPPRDTARIVRELDDEYFFSLVSPRILSGGAVALLPYRHPSVRAVITEAKFNHSARAISLLSRVLADYYASVTEETAALDARLTIFVPVPLGPRRLAERGYNQTARIAGAAGLPVTKILRRVRETVPQTSLSRRERLKNVENAFETTGPVDPAATYIVLDDVTTTGATLAAARAAITLAGAAKVQCLALAH